MSVAPPGCSFNVLSDKCTFLGLLRNRSTFMSSPGAIDHIWALLPTHATIHCRASGFPSDAASVVTHPSTALRTEYEQTQTV
jgi:hypothetical protein